MLSVVERSTSNLAGWELVRSLWSRRVRILRATAAFGYWNSFDKPMTCFTRG
jgi:hypothetical protein